MRGEDYPSEPSGSVPSDHGMASQDVPREWRQQARGQRLSRLREAVPRKVADFHGEPWFMVDIYDDICRYNYSSWMLMVFKNQLITWGPQIVTTFYLNRIFHGM